MHDCAIPGDGTWPHRTVDLLDVLREHFDNRIITLQYVQHTGTDTYWPPLFARFDVMCPLCLRVPDMPHLSPKSKSNWETWKVNFWYKLDHYSWLVCEFCFRTTARRVVAAKGGNFENFSFSFYNMCTPVFGFSLSATPSAGECFTYFL